MAYGFIMFHIHGKSLQRRSQSWSFLPLKEEFVDKNSKGVGEEAEGSSEALLQCILPCYY